MGDLAADGGTAAARSAIEAAFGRVPASPELPYRQLGQQLLRCATCWQLAVATIVAVLCAGPWLSVAACEANSGTEPYTRRALEELCRSCLLLLLQCRAVGCEIVGS